MVWVIKAFKRVLFDEWTKTSISSLTADAGAALQVIEERASAGKPPLTWYNWLHDETVVDMSQQWLKYRKYRMGVEPDSERHAELSSLPQHALRTDFL